jgi:hypothetical protein
MAVAKFETVLHQNNEDVKTMPPLPPRSPTRAALNFGVEFRLPASFAFRTQTITSIGRMKRK